MYSTRIFEKSAKKSPLKLSFDEMGRDGGGVTF
jgi:hypothetical protein